MCYVLGVVLEASGDAAAAEKYFERVETISVRSSPGSPTRRHGVTLRDSGSIKRCSSGLPAVIPVQELGKLAVVREVPAFAGRDVSDLSAPGRRRRVLGPESQNEHVVAGLTRALIHVILSIFT